jgi:hypothetical protein
LDFHTCICDAKLCESSHVDFSSKGCCGTWVDNLIVVIMETLQKGGGLIYTFIAKKLFVLEIIG